MKKLSILALILIAGCSKSKPVKPPASASFDEDSVVGVPQTHYHFDTKYGVLACSYTPGVLYSPIGHFAFFFSEDSAGVGYGLSFEMPADSTSNTFLINQSFTCSIGGVFNSPPKNMSVSGGGGVLTIDVTRYSNNTIDGNFSLILYGAIYNAVISNGVFVNVPVTGK